MKKDNSEFIFETYYRPDGKLLKVYLRDGTELEGRFIGYFHGDAESKEPFIIKWHFLQTDNPDIFQAVSEMGQTNNREVIIMNEDIIKVEFK